MMTSCVTTCGGILMEVVASIVQLTAPLVIPVVLLTAMLVEWKALVEVLA